MGTRKVAAWDIIRASVAHLRLLRDPMQLVRRPVGGAVVTTPPTEGHWSVGISVWCLGENRWGANLQFQDGGFSADPHETKGTLEARATGPLDQVVDALLAAAARIGIVWYNPTVYADRDGDDPDYPLPDGWQKIVNDQSRRIGWQPYYRSEPTIATISNRSGSWRGSPSGR